MADEDPAGFMPYFSRKAVTIQRQKGGKQAWPCSTTQTSCDTKRNNTDKTPMQAKPCKPGTPSPDSHVWGRQEQDQVDAGVMLSRVWQVPVPPSHTVPLTFLLMCSRRCSWPCRKQRCWNSVSSRSGLTSPPCSMFTTFLKPSAQRGQG